MYHIELPRDMKAAHIFEGLVQTQLVGEACARSFGDLARKHFDILTAPLGNDSNRIDVVFGQYRDISIKGGERSRRRAHSTMEIAVRSTNTHVLKQWAKYLVNPKNTSNLFLK